MPRKSNVKKEKKPKTLLSEEQKTIVNAIRIPIFVCIGLLIIVFLMICRLHLGQSYQAYQISKNQKYAASIEVSQENNATRIQELAQTLGTMNEKLTATDLVDNVMSLTKQQAEIKSNTLLANQQLKGLNASIHSRLSKQEKDLDELISNLKKDYQVINDSANKLAAGSAGANLTETDKYRIYSVAPYGVIIQNKEGAFIIAQINKELDVGAISAISESKVIAGNKFITHQKDFKIDSDADAQN